MKHIYIHFPYCLYKCHYCDFNSHAYEKEGIPHKNYKATLLKEIELKINDLELKQTSFTKDPIETIFIGGGTPSLMDPKDLEDVLFDLNSRFGFSENIEVTLEMNPGTVTQEKLKEFKTIGVNRVSIGVQSFQEKYLKSFGRIHTSEEAKKVISQAKSIFENLSIDLIFGFPGQTLEEWQENLKIAADFDLPHLSCYSLTAEEGTIYTADIKKGVLQESDNDTLYSMQKYTYDFLKTKGYQTYEISNFSKPKKECRHNLAYWCYQSYLGLGAGACSQFVLKSDNQFVERQTNQKLPETYMRTVADGENYFLQESINQKTAMIEYLMMGFRTCQGISLDEFEMLFGVPLLERYSDCISELMDLRLLEKRGDFICVTEEGLFQHNRILLIFME